MSIQIKICCIASKSEAQLALKYGANYLGLVAEMPSGPGVISDEQINTINKSIPQHSSILLTSRTTAKSIIAHIHATGVHTIQIVDAIDENEYQLIKKEIPTAKLIQVIHVTGKEALDQSATLQNKVDFLLLDSGQPDAKTKVLGGTGKTHNWDISAQIVKASKLPVFLAGGLHANNVEEAIKIVKPYGVDLCSGVRTNGQLDEQKLAAFVRAARK